MVYFWIKIVVYFWAVINTYQPFWQENPARFDINPYFMKLFKQRWYLLAYNPTKEKILTYSLDRIKQVETTEKRFDLPKDLDFASYFDESFGIISGEEIPAETVRIKVLNNQDAYIKALPLHSSQKVITTNGDYTIFEYYIKPTYDFRQELLSHGSHVEVLKPEWFREEIKEILKELNKMYS